MNTVRPVRPARISVRGAAEVPIVDLAYGSPVTIVPEPYDDFYLVTTTLEGTGTVSSGHREVEYAPNRTVITSPGKHYCFRFDSSFRQRSVRIERRRLHRFLSDVTGTPLNTPIDFALQPFTQELNDRWNGALALLDGKYGSAGLSPRALRQLQELLMIMIIEAHPHDKCTIAREPHRIAPRKVRLAEDFIHAHACERIAMSDIAAAAGCSIRSLQSTFRAVHETTPTAYLRNVRLDRAYEALVNSSDEETVTHVALSNGFSHLGRFCAAFAKRFGEKPESVLKNR